jgi:tRNA 2-thiouridine synthesizing protein A
MPQNASDNEPEFMALRGLKCPLPALMARRALEARQPGALVLVLVDDPMAPIDIPHMCRQEGHAVIDDIRDGETARITLRRGP